jgi:hypothetical protein
VYPVPLLSGIMRFLSVSLGKEVFYIRGYWYGSAFFDEDRRHFHLTKKLKVA